MTSPDTAREWVAELIEMLEEHGVEIRDHGQRCLIEVDAGGLFWKAHNLGMGTELRGWSRDFVRREIERCKTTD